VGEVERYGSEVNLKALSAVKEFLKGRRFCIVFFAAARFAVVATRLALPLRQDAFLMLLSRFLSESALVILAACVGGRRRIKRGEYEKEGQTTH
jgi:hypothetical protein